ncbi:hypothetical protein OS493_028553 [Desmophyllum pertusum]|uniref:VWFA domain-containing protein n=1 Tax=Desmophyllum pertusum TaxID=174260 RepID=A0A9W9YZK1_9CNID|nr:hypothetical protein OS493_028553 [Desmophyllum pertusum]
MGSFHCLCPPGIQGRLCEQVCSKSAKSGRYDLGLVIDGSEVWLPVSAEGTHYGIIVYSNDAKIIVRFSERWYHALLSLKLRVLGMEFPDGDTRTDKALKMAGTELYKAGEDRDQVPNVLVVITDGKTAQGSEPYKRVLKPLKDHDVDVIAVGIGDQISKAELTEIAMGKQDRVIQVDKVEDLNINKLSEMIHSIC